MKGEVSPRTPPVPQVCVRPAAAGVRVAGEPALLRPVLPLPEAAANPSLRLAAGMCACVQRSAPKPLPLSGGGSKPGNDPIIGSKYGA